MKTRIKITQAIIREEIERILEIHAQDAVALYQGRKSHDGSDWKYRGVEFADRLEALIRQAELRGRIKENKEVFKQFKRGGANAWEISIRIDGLTKQLEEMEK